MALDDRAPVEVDIKVIGLVGSAHFISHFFQLALPPLFPVLKVALGVSYTELGLLSSIFFLSSALAQTPIGFLVDKVGARSVLIGGIMLLGGAYLFMGIFASYSAFLALAILAGLGNAVFHPSDFAILSASVSPARLGRAFSFHTFGGNMGWVVAPVVVISLDTLFGWKLALVILGAGGLLLGFALAWQKTLLRNESETITSTSENNQHQGHTSNISSLLNIAIIASFIFFLFLAMAQLGLQSFSVTALTAIYPIDIAKASTALTAFLAASTIGVLMGGFTADKLTDPGKIVAYSFGTTAGIYFCMGALTVPFPVMFSGFIISGALLGLAMPSRDLIVRRATPPGATGRVFGFVYSGLDLGASVTPVLFGVFMDLGQPRWLYYALALIILASVTSVLIVRQRTTG